MDIQHAGLIGDLLFGFNDVAYRWIALSDWELAACIDTSGIDLSSALELLLEFDVEQTPSRASR